MTRREDLVVIVGHDEIPGVVGISLTACECVAGSHKPNAISHGFNHNIRDKFIMEFFCNKIIKYVIASKLKLLSQIKKKTSLYSTFPKEIITIKTV